MASLKFPVSTDMKAHPFSSNHHAANFKASRDLATGRTLPVHFQNLLEIILHLGHWQEKQQDRETSQTFTSPKVIAWGNQCPTLQL